MCKTVKSVMFTYNVYVDYDVSDHSKTLKTCSNTVKKIQICWNLFLAFLKLKRCLKVLLKSLCFQ